jgi:hypothetical protein
MSSTVQSPYSPEQIKVWLRGLLTIAWADGHFDEEEKSLITSITQDELAPNLDFSMPSSPFPQQNSAVPSGPIKLPPKTSSAWR